VQREATSIGYARAFALPRSMRTLLPEANLSPLPDIVNKAVLAENVHRDRIQGRKSMDRWGGLFVRTKDRERRVEVGRQTTSKGILLRRELISSRDGGIIC
jgi:hypothetical protein